MKKTLLDKRRVEFGTILRWAVLAALILAAGALLFRSHTPAAPQGIVEQPPVQTLPPTGERTIRETGYDRDLAALQKLTEQTDLDAALRQDAAQQMQKLIQNHQTELALEEALQNAGYSGCLVIAQGDSITVSLGSRQLSQESTAAILGLCLAHSDTAAENIRIMALDDPQAQ